uniref:Uncharacterized protein n=1 Tax=Romanomermis culicivorax TaxID=13658 RepID=A0A915I5H0_ROMCU
MFVKGQHSNPACSRNFTSSDRPLYKFKALFADCDVKMED